MSKNIPIVSKPMITMELCLQMFANVTQLLMTKCRSISRGHLNVTTATFFQNETIFSSTAFINVKVRFLQGRAARLTFLTKIDAINRSKSKNSVLPSSAPEAHIVTENSPSSVFMLTLFCCHVVSLSRSEAE